MSYMKTCNCGKENWIVIHYKHNHSAFESPKYGWHESRYSVIQCQKCNAIFSSKSKYVDNLPQVNGGCCRLNINEIEPSNVGSEIREKL